jgi:hypothetical protein
MQISVHFNFKKKINCIQWQVNTREPKYVPEPSNNLVLKMVEPFHFVDVTSLPAPQRLSTPTVAVAVVYLQVYAELLYASLTSLVSLEHVECHKSLPQSDPDDVPWVCHL